jgi:hypothetical protein
MNTKISYAAHQLNSDQIVALKDTILVKDMVFKERMVGSILIVKDDGKDSGIRPRWAEVYKVGPDQRDVKVGEFVMVAHGRWTRGIDIEDENGLTTIRKVDPKDILLVSDIPMIDETQSDKVR